MKEVWNDLLITLLSQEFLCLSISAALGLLLGIERAIHHKSASIRTFSLICTGSCLFSILSSHFLTGDPTRVAANIVTGIGFLGGGVIFKAADKVEGITTGSMVWFVAAIGMCCGFNYISLAILSFLLYTVILIVGKLAHKLIDRVCQ